MRDIANRVYRTYPGTRNRNGMSHKQVLCWLQDKGKPHSPFASWAVVNKFNGQGYILRNTKRKFFFVGRRKGIN